jgi:hypothetical protein
MADEKDKSPVFMGIIVVGLLTILTGIGAAITLTEKLKGRGR